MKNTKKLHVGLLFGGNSSEHDVSKRSAHNIYDAMDKNKYVVDLFLIAKNGVVLSSQASRKIFDGADENKVVANEMKKIDFSKPLANISNLNSVNDIDVFFPIIHGNLGEDGTIQGLLRLLKKPYVGSGILESAMGFDKDITKQLLTYHGIQNTKYILLTPANYKQWNYAKLSHQLGKLIFLKPANQGSSVGIHQIHNQSEFESGLKDAFKYDYKILAEQAIEGPEEIEISILGNEHPIASQLGAIKVPKQDKFYTYQNKFVDASQVHFEIPVKVSQKLTDRITKMALDAYKVLGLKGMARADFLVSSSGEPYLGEVNTLPGFTNISLYPQLWKASGISYSDLIERLIKLAYQEFDRQSKLRHDFEPLD
ncbi:D-alanine--D-alanine ligase [Philodulcilactobacillus myokoensis]|uniref:D-alanine--D-alanine ligase n=1 Tax=Philodulcilactobacillus myokoensis TaxID=2929573 RepID=A0A9W6B1H6_9LACO|nr:D-alanine--D-alanine ligase family protein [Philodulcilactobacillus myokoensis]GLB47066.1 D-alanine--D-alanine ligase [Philodulcilactobacillus myokoensis]